MTFKSKPNPILYDQNICDKDKYELLTCSFVDGITCHTRLQDNDEHNVGTENEIN